MKSTEITPVKKPKRNHLDEFLPLYRKLGESCSELKTNTETEKHNVTQSEFPKYQRPSHKPVKHAVDLSQINIDGSNLNSNAGSSTPRNEGTSTPGKSKKQAKIGKVKKPSALKQSESKDSDSNNLSQSKSKKRTKSVSFLLEESDQVVVKKSKSDGSQDGATGDTPREGKKVHKKYKKNEKEIEDEERMNQEKQSEKKKAKKNKNQASKIPEVVVDEDVIKDGKSKKIKAEIKKAKKLKHQDKLENDSNLISKSSKTLTIVDNLESLNLGDNTHTLTNLIDEMAVVDKEKQKKLRKLSNRENKQNQNETDSKNKHNKINHDRDEINNRKNHSKASDTDQNQNEIDDTTEGNKTEKKKWTNKRWNKSQVAERDQHTTVNVDNLPVSLLKGNFKKIIIDHFSKYGLSRSVGEPFVQDEEAANPVFTAKVFFDSSNAATEALEMNGSTIAGNEIHVSEMLPMTETALVLRMYGDPGKLNKKYVQDTFKDVGLIRSIRPILRKKKTMTTIFVEFDGPKTVERALKKCANLALNEKKIMCNRFEIVATEKKNNKKSKRKRMRAIKKKKSMVASGNTEDSKMASNNSDSNEESDDE